MPVAEGPRAGRLPVRECQWPLQCASAPLSRRPGPAGTVSEACRGAGPRLSEACSHGQGGPAQMPLPMRVRAIRGCVL